MDENKHFQRVRESAETVAALIGTASNVPLDQYIDIEDARALAAAMSIEPADMTVADLERLLLIRDGLYDVLTEASDKGAEGDHSIEQLINALSRLYVDLERATKSQGTELQAATDQLSTHQSTPSAVLAGRQDAISAVTSEANSVISQTNITNRTININILNFDVGKLELFRNLKIDINRLSASVFAIKMQFEKGVLFEGTIKFLNEGVDRILKDISGFAEQISNAYRSGKELVSSISPLLEKGTRFVKLIGSFITAFFDGPTSTSLPDYKFTLRTGYRSNAITSAVALENGQIIFGGRAGALITASAQSAQVIPQPVKFPGDIRCLGDMRNGDLAVGTEDGLSIYRVRTNQTVVHSSYNERIDALAVPPWGGLGSAIVTGAFDGALRRYSLSGGLTQFRTDVANREGGKRLARSVQAAIVWEDKVLVAAGESLFLLDAQFEVLEEIKIDRKVLAFCKLTDETVAVVGKGLLAEVNLARGTFARIMAVSPKSDYMAVAYLGDGVVAAGTADGSVRAIHMASGTEIGEINLDIILRGLIVRGSVIYAYGGGWKSVGKAILELSWSKAAV